MNVSDTEIVRSILSKDGYQFINSPEAADVILLNTCSIRENAETTIHKRLANLNTIKKENENLVVGILGCMAKQSGRKLLQTNDMVGIVAGPDEYRKLPELITNCFEGIKGMAVNLSRIETYDDITPLRTEGVSAWLTIMRGCDNFCSYCVVPFARGRERSRVSSSLISEIEKLTEQGFREITLLGQNVNSYKCPESGDSFSTLLEKSAAAGQGMRIRYVTSHPKDMSPELIEAMARNHKICNHIHLPVQSGSNDVLKAMRRDYTKERFLELTKLIRSNIPDASITTDIIAGYPGETQQDHEETLELMQEVQFDGAFMFKYSPREGTKAFKVEDSVPEEEKAHRLNEIIQLQSEISKLSNLNEIGRLHEILVEKPSKRNRDEWVGRTDTNKTTIFPNKEGSYKAGDFVNLKITRSTSATLFGEVVQV
ncbi:MAG: modification enzyme, MiaB family [Ignavibacteria bacterium]|nr:modification enzyme, MiaB family [Ignavibacteria bacterium]